ncbi:esterase/lipase family protein [Desulfovibrio sp. TomC]|uniref:esterase/lipase family protein n=1 Tax=Desulfovibrio sp. TomC TaxID=1562888 RepID=UPI0005755F01|nr:alpha/beta fold hydrolase [Desulfovibrio sp. TomC]KHK02868.1 putative secreted lipase [Desulfovibrio sp. TomC]
MTALYFLLLLPIVAVLVVTGLSYAAFVLALATGRQTLFPRPWAGRGLSELAQGLGSAVAGLCVMMAAYPLGGRLSVRSRGGRCAAGETVVVCLHGLYHNPSAFLAIRPALVRAGFSRVVLPGYRSHGTDFEAEVRRVAAILDQTVPADARLCFLGHSLGGLVARRLAAEPGYARRTLAVITLGTPHQGSALACLAVGRLGRSLVPGSPLLARIAALADPPGATLVAVVSPVDNLVVPDCGLDPARPGWQVVVTPPVAHVAMLYHRGVIALVASLLARVAQPPIGDKERDGAA